MTSTRRFVLHVRQRAAVQTDRETLHPFALSPARDRPPPIAPYQRCSEFGIRDCSFNAIRIKRRVVKSNLQLNYVEERGAKTFATHISPVSYRRQTGLSASRLVRSCATICAGLQIG